MFITYTLNNRMQIPSTDGFA